MTSAEAPPSPAQTKAEEIPLEDIEKLLEAEDPEFSKELEQVKSVENNPDVNIEATVVNPDDSPEEKSASESRIAKLRARMRLAIFNFKQSFKSRLKSLGRETLVFLKTKPKEYALYSFAMSKIIAKKIFLPIKLFRETSGAKRLAVLTLIAVALASAWVLLNNMRGVWIPGLNEPILADLRSKADWVSDFDPKEGAESFYSAFPQERHEFLFSRMKVNLKPGPDSPNPMGAFEVIVLLDSKDTAIEVRDREVEFFDALQRVFEDETFNDLESDLGKGRVKGRVKRELNQKLTQGWVKDVSFKTFVLKP